MHLLNVHHCLKIKKGRAKNTMENIARSADGVGRACAWAGGSGQGQNKYQELWTRRPRKEKVSGNVLRRKDGDGSQRSCIDVALSSNFYYFAFYSVAAKFQSVSPVSDNPLLGETNPQCKGL